MKIKSILMASALVLGLVSAADATNYIRFTGSTAFRSTMNTAILNSMDSGVTYGYIGSSLGSANQVIYIGNIGGVSTIVKTSWTGSEAGIQAVGNSITAKYLDDGVTTSSGGTSGLTAGTTLETPDVALSDTLQATSQFSTTNTALTEVPGGTVGVVPFLWVASKNATILLTGGTTATPNITTAAVKALYPSGKLPVAFFTGNSADETKWIFAIGRNPDSGTRLSAFAEAGLGAIASVKQYAPVTGTAATGTNNLISGGLSTVARLNLWPVETINGISTVTVGNSGYNSGGDLCYALGSNDDSVYVAPTQYTGNAGLLGYAGQSDVSKATGGTGHLCSWNGVVYSPAAVEEGLYSFWSFEHLYYRTGADTSVSDFSNTVAIAARALPGVQVPLTSLHVTRTKDGGTISRTY